MDENEVSRVARILAGIDENVASSMAQGSASTVLAEPTSSSARRRVQEVHSRSRSEIINWVLGNEELIRVCICPYCLKIHSRRDNTRTHIKHQHPGSELRDFRMDSDATLGQVRHANENAAFTRIVEKRSLRAVSEGDVLGGGEVAAEEHVEPDRKVFFNANPSDTAPPPLPLQPFIGGSPIDQILSSVSHQMRLGLLEGSSSVMLRASKPESRESSPNCSLLSELNGVRSSGDSRPSSSSSASLPLPFGCVVCPCSFAAVSELAVHVQRTHRTRFRCNACLAEFVHADHLSNHFHMCHVINQNTHE